MLFVPYPYGFMRSASINSLFVGIIGMTISFLFFKSISINLFTDVVMVVWEVFLSISRSGVRKEYHHSWSCACAEAFIVRLFGLSIGIFAIDSVLVFMFTYSKYCVVCKYCIEIEYIVIIFLTPSLNAVPEIVHRLICIAICIQPTIKVNNKSEYIYRYR